MTSSSVSAVVVTYNSETFIAACLESFARQTVPVQTIVVDNGSSDRTRLIVRERFPGVRLIELGRNTGFCHANNRGIAESQSEFVLVANPDTRAWPDYLERAMAAFSRGPRTGAVAGKLLRFDGVTIDSAGQILTRSRKIQDRGFDQKDTGQYDTAVSVDAACGAMALYRRAMIDDISIDGQFFDEDFFAFCEDMDVGWQARRFGWEVVYAPDAIAQHFRGGTQDRHSRWTNLVRMGGRSGELKYHIVKNRWLMMIKNDTVRDYLNNAPFIWARDLALTGYLALSSPRALMRMVAEPGVFGRAWKKRQRIQQRIQDARQP